VNVTLSPTADAILSQHTDFRDRLLEALGGQAGSYFIDGKVGRGPRDDSLVVMCQNRPPLAIAYYEFANAANVQRIIRDWPTSDSD
jgi:hypothetical protein